jgi:hypothetical protein
MSTQNLPVKVSIHRTSLSATPAGAEMQHIATVYIQGDEYRVQAPPAAGGRAIEWLDQASVVYTNYEGIGLGDSDASPPLRVLAISAVKEELEKRAALSTTESFYHVRLNPLDGRPEMKFDMTRSELESRVLKPYQNLQPVVLGGRTIQIENLERLEIFETPFPSSKLQPLVRDLGKQGVREWNFSEPEIKDVTDQFVTTPSVSTIPQNMDAIDLVCDRFHAVARQLRSRHASRPTLDVSDEYDVQDLLHALLRIFFKDVRPEEWTPSYAGKASRMDFLVPTEHVVVETKKTRPGLGTKEIGDELLVDIARYKKHPSCRRLVCFVYDPDGRIANPAGIEADLNRIEDGLEVKVIIMPRQ